VLVVGDDIDSQLAPFHEFECTGQDDQYVQDVDRTKEALEEYNRRTTRMYVDQDGKRHHPYEDRFYRDPTPDEEGHVSIGSGSRPLPGGGHISFTSKDWGDGRGYRPKVHFLPEGWQELEVPMSEVESFDQFVESWYGAHAVPHGQAPDLEGDNKYGYAMLDENGNVQKVVRRTNPNARWDWYQVGGRWRGFFRLKDAHQAVDVRLGNDPFAALGTPGVFDNEPLHDADSVLKMDVDFEGMREDGRRRAHEAWDKVRAAAGDLTGFETWEQVRDRLEPDTAAAREAYREQPVIKRIQEAAKKDDDMPWFDVDDFLTIDREEYGQRGALQATMTHAYVKDGEWHEAGEMGWWAVVHDEMDEKLWAYKFNNMLDDLPGDTMLTLVDCHI
jgi:hypothetical protein